MQSVTLIGFGITSIGHIWWTLMLRTFKTLLELRYSAKQKSTAIDAWHFRSSDDDKLRGPQHHYRFNLLI